jgi:hypothetical protein
MKKTILLLASLLAAACSKGKPLTFGELDKRLGADELCSALLQGQVSAGPIQGRQDGGPFGEVAPDKILNALPKDQGAMTSCAAQDFAMQGDETRKSLYVEYAGARRIVDLTYAGLPYPVLKSFALRSPAAPSLGGALKMTSGFSGHYGYLLSFPESYDVYASMGKKNKTMELAYFYPKGTVLPVGESEYKALGIVRLEAGPLPQNKGKFLTMDEFQEVVSYTLNNNKETFTVQKLRSDKPAFRVDITAPKPIIQLFVMGKNAFYTFTGGDEKLLGLMAGSIKEAGTPDLPQASAGDRGR